MDVSFLIYEGKTDLLRQEILLTEKAFYCLVSFIVA